jgi:hypothetical protein
MTAERTSLLPYRAEPEELIGWVQDRVRGREGARAARAPKTQEGLAQSAGLLGLVLAGAATDRGRELALADGSARRMLIREAMFEFAAYRQLFDAIRSRGKAMVETTWIESWWASHGYGNSPSNRQEGTAVLGRLAEYVGLGQYVPGRRGHPTRINWTLEELPGDGEFAPNEFVMDVAPASPQDPARSARPTTLARTSNRATVTLAGGLTARLEVPSHLPREEKRRLLEILNLMVREEQAT